jgi:hypothetical protein
LNLLVLTISADVLAGEEVSQRWAEWEKQLEMLRSVPYVSYSESIADDSEDGVVLHDPRRSYNGYNFYCTEHSGKAFLLDMEGREVYRWEYSPKGSAVSDHALLLDNGDLVVIRAGDLLRLNCDSDPLWEKKLSAHHDVAQAPDGSFYVVTRKCEDYRETRVWFDALVHVTADGKEIDRWFTYDHLDELRSVLDTRSFLDTALDSILCGRAPEGTMAATMKRRLEPRGSSFDYFHMNTVSVLPATVLGERDSRFQQGNLLVCFRNVNQIAVLEKGTYHVLWGWGEGELQEPHHPTILENGHILVFDNGTQREYSRVLELGAVAGTVVWEYLAEQPKRFYSCRKGSAQRLPNGNTLICESDRGRCFEVTRQGEVVWMWLNPAGHMRHRQHLYRMLRLSPAQVDHLLRGRWWWWE